MSPFSFLTRPADAPTMPISFRSFWTRSVFWFVTIVLGPTATVITVAGDEGVRATNLFSSQHTPADYSGIKDSDEFRYQRRPRVDADDRRWRVAFLGNTLIHRTSEFGYLETELTRLMPDQDLVFRNLAWPGDTIHGAARTEFGPGEEDRSRWQRPGQDTSDYGFRKMIAQIKRERPDILLIAYGSNVAFEGANGLAAFEQGLDKLLDVLEPTGVRIVLLATPPREVQRGPMQPFREQNGWLQRLSGRLREVAAARQLRFVDLYGRWPVQEGDETYTDNGIHLNDRGYQLFAKTIASSLLAPAFQATWHLHLHADGHFVSASHAEPTNVRVTEYGMRWSVLDHRLPSSIDANLLDPSIRRRLRIDDLEAGTYSLDIDGRRVARGNAEQWARGMAIHSGPDHAQVAELRRLIQQKNRHDFYGFRPQNKAYIHLFRRHERGHHAAEVERFELIVRELEDEIARLRVPRRRIYELVKETDYPEHEVPDEFTAADIESELAAFDVPDGFEINLFASNPMITKPININWDERGRMWVATSSIYPHLQPGQTPNDQIIILEDLDRDGRADKRTLFADGLLVPHSVIPGHGGAYVAQSTDLLFLRDTDEDGRADERQVVLTGFGNADVHHMIHALRWGPDGDLYFNQSIYINSVVETPWGVCRSNGSCIWRLRPDTLKLEKLSQGLVNPWGHAFDRWGQSFATDGAGGGGIAYAFPGSAFRSHGYAGRELPSLNEGARPKECGLEVLSGRHLPATWRETLMSNDFRANRVTRYKLNEEGSGYRSHFLGDMITSSHRGFRPVDVKMGPDGAIYIADWYNLIIDHGEVDFHHPLRDKRHGRIWRLTVKNTETIKYPELAGASVDELLKALTLPEQWTRDQARRLLRQHAADEVMPALNNWLRNDSHSEHARLEALWVCQGLRVINAELLGERLGSSDHRVRAAAVRVLADWQHAIPDATQLLAKAVSDPHAQVRLEGINALRRLGTLEAIELALGVLDRPMDPWLDFALFRTVHELQDRWIPSFQQGKPLFDGDPERIAFAVSAVGDRVSLIPLEQLIREGRLHDGQLPGVLAVLSAFGDARQRTLVVEHMIELPPKQAATVLRSLLRSAVDVVPPNAARLGELFDARDPRVRLLAIELAGRWRVPDAFATLAERANDIRTTADERLAAGQALVAIDRQRGSSLLRTISQSAPTEVQATAVAAWSRGSVDQAAPEAVRLLAKTADPPMAALLISSFLSQRNGSQRLAQALDSVQLAPPIARAAIEQVRSTGREHSEIIAALRVAGKLGPSAQTLTADEIREILRDAATRGDAERGAGVFRRKRLQCLTCHAVDGTGGRVGPDLSSLGGSARTSDILQSMLDPSATIKEGYQTTHVVTVDGRVITGIVQQQTDMHLRIRDAKDNLQTVHIDDIDEIEPSQLSIMPTGLTEMLSRDELVDLVTYLSRLGRKP